MKGPESKNSEINVYISAKELKVCHKFSSVSSLRQAEVRNVISYKIIIMHKIKTYQLFQRNTHFPNLKPAQHLPQLLTEGTLSNFGDTTLQHIENSTLWLSDHGQLGIHAKTQFNKCSSKGLPNHMLHAHSFVFARLYPGIHFFFVFS